MSVCRVDAQVKLKAVCGKAEAVTALEIATRTGQSCVSMTACGYMFVGALATGSAAASESGAVAAGGTAATAWEVAMGDKEAAVSKGMAMR